MYKILSEALIKWKCVISKPIKRPMLYSLGKCISICCTCFTWQCEFQSWIQQHTNAEKEEFFAANNVISRLKTSRLQLCLRPYLFDFANHLQTYQLTSISNQRYDLRRNSQKVTKCDLTKNAEVAKSLFFHFCSLKWHGESHENSIDYYFEDTPFENRITHQLVATYYTEGSVKAVD